MAASIPYRITPEHRTRPLRIADDYLADVLSGKGFLVFDGAMGSLLQRTGLLVEGTVPELLNLTDPEAITAIHRQYVEAGAQAITTNTFGANRLKLAGKASIEEIFRAAAACARNAGAQYVCADIGPLGALLEPMGTMTFDEAYELFAEQVRAAVAAHCDLLVFETLSDLTEAKAALLAATENSDLPAFVTMTFEEDGRTFLGTPPEVAAITLSSLGASALGMNCSVGPNEALEFVETMAAHSRVPLMVQPNAGLPRMVEGETVYDVTPEAFVETMAAIVDAGATIVGGCCGTNPDFIRGLRAFIDDSTLQSPTLEANAFAVTSGQQALCLPANSADIAVIGERINPTGKPKLKEALHAGDLDYLIAEAVSQQGNGADLLDVNVGLPELDEASTLHAAVALLQASTTLPLVIDSSDPEAIERTVRSYCGKPLVNSVNGKQESLDAILPLAAHYGCAVIGLCLDENGIPSTAEERFAIAQRIVDEAATYGIPAEDIVIDCLTMAVATNQNEAMEILRGIALVKERLGCRTTLGVSNISFGLPQRNLLSSTFLAAAFGAGLDLPIINPSAQRYRDVVTCYRVINGQDQGAVRYIQNRAELDDPYEQPIDAVGIPTASQEQRSPKPVNQTCIPVPAPLEDATDEVRAIQDYILTGRKEPMAQATRTLLAKHDPIDVIDGVLIPTLDEVGIRFDRGTFFLPQLMASAEAVKAGFDVVKEHMGDTSVDAGKRIILATVKGDIHDIGKNIVKMLLENYGYQVLDLGRDVPPQTIVDAALEHNVRLIGLSALMTTTVKAMEETIALLKEQVPDAKTFVGGAVLTADYAETIGATWYSKDAAESARIAERFFAEQ